LSTREHIGILQGVGSGVRAERTGGFSEMAVGSGSAHIVGIEGSLMQHPDRRLEKTMLTETTQHLPTANSETRQAGLLKKALHGAVVAGTVAALSLTTLTAVPSTARAGGPGVGAAIGLGILGGALASAAIASTAPPVYAAPSPYYYPNGYYYGTAPVYYSQPYYGNYAYPSYSYPQYYGYYR
jgi:hypothetical protein